MKKNSFVKNKDQFISRTELIKRKLTRNEDTKNKINKEFLKSLPDFNSVKDGFLTVS